MTDYTELKRLAVAIESCTSIPEEDEAAWMRRTTGQAVIELLDELENFQAEVPKWTEREIKLIADLDEARNGMKHSCAIRLKKQVEQLETERDQLKAENEALVAAAQAVRDEWRKDQADAERYRWLRENAQQDVDGWRNEVPVLVHAMSHVSGWKDRIDVAIDAAMGKGEQS